MNLRLALTRAVRAPDVALTAMLVVQCSIMFVAAPFAALGYAVARHAMEALIVVLVSLVTLLARRGVNRVVAVIATGSVLTGPIMRLTLQLPLVGPSGDAASLIGMIALGYIVATAVFAPGRVNAHRLLGAIVLYLDVALLFSTAYRLVLDFLPDGFTGLEAGADEPRIFASLLYFSFVTLTSTGFGDIVPAHPFLRSLVNLEGVIGQLYPATLLASLVTQHLEARSRRVDTNQQRVRDE